MVNQALAVAILARFGYRAEVAGNGREAVAQAVYRAVLMDWRRGSRRRLGPHKWPRVVVPGVDPGLDRVLEFRHRAVGAAAQPNRPPRRPRRALSSPSVTSRRALPKGPRSSMAVCPSHDALARQAADQPRGRRHHHRGHPHRNRAGRGAAPDSRDYPLGVGQQGAHGCLPIAPRWHGAWNSTLPPRRGSGIPPTARPPPPRPQAPSQRPWKACLPGADRHEPPGASATDRTARPAAGHPDRTAPAPATGSPTASRDPRRRLPAEPHRYRASPGSRPVPTRSPHPACPGRGAPRQPANYRQRSPGHPPAAGTRRLRRRPCPTTILHRGSASGVREPSTRRAGDEITMLIPSSFKCTEQAPTVNWALVGLLDEDSPRGRALRGAG
jgi:hypothetical protein